MRNSILGSRALWLLLIAVAGIGMSAASSANPMVKIETSAGDIVLRLYSDKSPKTVENFLGYVERKHYDGTLFHRVMEGFMIQGGGFDVDLKQKVAEQKVVNESKNRLHNTRGTIAMARLSDPDSASAQFIINHKDNERLDWTPFKAGYTVFGKVVTGMRVVDYIASTPTGDAIATLEKGQAPLRNVPLEPIVIERISLVSP
ncbi:MAG: peptidylprolyl isomerase [Luminiphilus sp.]|nr:peptidylprolyl isomerase [Luminiphilus sp.]